MRITTGLSRSMLAHWNEARRRELHGQLKQVAVAGLAGATLAACGGAGSTSASIDPGDDFVDGELTFDYDTDGPVVGKLRVRAPETTHLIIRGTLPVPPGLVVEGDDRVPLSIISGPDPTVAVTQIETVSRYSRAEDGADVVELMAHVRRPHDVEPGTMLDYDVVYSPQDPIAFLPAPAVEELMAAPGALKLVAHDPLGHRYESNFLDQARSRSGGVEMVREGAVVNEVRVPSVLLPVNEVEGAAGTLPRLMGVTAYVRMFRRQDFFAIDLHVHNAFDGQDDSVDWDTPITDLYFEDLSLRLPQGWKVLHAFDNPYSGPAQNSGPMQEAPIVGALAEGKMHLMPRQSQFSRRLVITRESAEDLARVELERGNLGFCVDGTSQTGDKLWSWWNEATARYLPQNYTLPDLSGMISPAAVAAEAEATLAQRLEQVRLGTTGSYPVNEGNLGWAHPFGVDYGGMTGGDRIEQIPGVHVAWSASPEAYRLTELNAKMVLERQPFALISSSGQPTRVEDETHPTGNHGSWVDYNLNMTFSGSPYFFEGSPDHQAAYVNDHGLAANYAERLREFKPIDMQHLIRYTGNLLTMSWLANDSLAKMQLHQTAELFRMTHHEHFTGNYGYVHGLTLKSRQRHVEQNPGVGVSYGRGEGWGLFTTIGAYAVGTEELRERYRPWLAEISRVVRVGQSDCTGNITAVRINKRNNGVYYTRQSFEHSFVINAMESMRRTVFEGVDETVADRIRTSVVDAAYSTVQAPFWDPGFGGHMKVVGVGRTDLTTPDFCQNLPADANYGTTDVDHNTPMPTWTFAYRLTGDPIFLQRATSSIGVSGNLEAEINMLGPDILPHSAHLLGLVQSLGSSQ